MEYLLLLHANEADWSNLTREQQQQGMAVYVAYTQTLKQAGIYRASNKLQPSSTAKTVRLSAGRPQVLDGPYAESKEVIAGYYIIDVPDLDAALSWAARCPAAGHGVVEVRGIEIAAAAARP
jgi:hypothetical protein